MIIPIKTSDKIQHLFIIKTLNKADIEGTYPNTLQAIYEKPKPIEIKVKINKWNLVKLMS